jgi:hypothetical protein
LGNFLEFLKASIADLITLLFSSLKNSKGGGDNFYDTLWRYFAGKFFCPQKYNKIDELTAI